LRGNFQAYTTELVSLRGSGGAQFTRQFSRFTVQPGRDNGTIDSLAFLDLAGTKASVVQLRAEAKDYIDIDALIMAGKVDLPLALSAAQWLYGSTFNPQITLKALSFFDDGDLRELPEDMKLRLATAAREVDLDRLPGIDKFSPRIAQDRGYEL